METKNIIQTHHESQGMQELPFAYAIVIAAKLRDMIATFPASVTQ